MIEKKITEKEYRQLDAINYSKLSGVDKAPISLISNNVLSTDSINFGSAVDCLLFDGKKTFDENFIVFENLPSSEIIIKIIKEFHEWFVKNNDSFNKLSKLLIDHSDKICEIARNNDYGSPKWKNETIKNRICIDDNQNYFNYLLNSNNKITIDQTTYNKVLKTKDCLINSEFTFGKFVNKSFEILTQYPIVWYSRNKKCKSLFDQISIDHEKKRIYPLDLKTLSGSNDSFGYGNYFKFKYYLQEAFYTDAIHYWKNEIETHLKDYIVMPFEFVIVQNCDYPAPLIYRGSQKTYELGKYGGSLKNNISVKGYLQLIGELEWHVENEKYNYKYEHYMNNGVLMLENYL